MSAEQLSGSNSEKNIQSPELTSEQLGNYLNAENALERGAENAKVESGEQLESKARNEALKEAVSVEAGGAEKKSKESQGAPAQRRHGVVSKKERNASYKRHMKSIQSEMPAPQRAFSKVIHNPVVEKASETLGATVARPNAILAGSAVAFFAVLAVYLISKYYGYTLSGFETIGAFIAGWVLGILFDFFKVMATGKR